MRVLALAVLMVGGLAVAVPASAEEFVGARVGGVGVGVDVGPHHRYRDRGRCGDRQRRQQEVHREPSASAGSPL